MFAIKNLLKRSVPYAHIWQAFFLFTFLGNFLSFRRHHPPEGSVNLTDYRAVLLSTGFPETTYAVTKGSPYIVDHDSLQVEHYALLYLDSIFGRAKGSGLTPMHECTSIHSVDAAACHLVDFLRYLVSCRQAEQSGGESERGTTEYTVQLPLHDFPIDDVINSRDDHLLTRVSTQTRETPFDGTCTRCVNRSLDDADWLQRRGALFNSGNLPDEDRVASLGDDGEDVVHPLSEKHRRQVRDLFEPLPSEGRQGTDECPTRNCLAFEIAKLTFSRL
jgi:hypothetical protein